MKTRSIIVIAAVLLLVGFSAAITWDQFQGLKAEKVRIEKDFKATQDELRLTKLSLKKAEQGKKEWMDRFAEVGAASQRLSNAQQALVDLKDLRIQRLEAKAGTQAVQAASTYRADSVSPVAQAKVNIPRWIPEAPVVVARKIKERAAREHGNDFTAAKYEIERQTEAHEKLLRYHRMNNTTVNDVLSKAAFDKGEDFQSMVWEVERQLEAAQVIQGR